jgi:hypothetical protein
MARLKPPGLTSFTFGLLADLVVELLPILALLVRNLVMDKTRRCDKMNIRL